MVDLEFKIVYEGRLRAGADKEKFVRVFSKHFNMSEPKARKLAEAGTDVVIKRNVNRDEALKIKKGLEAIGMVVRVEAMGGVPSPLADDSVAEKTQFMAPPPGFDARPPRRGQQEAIDEETQFMEPPSGFVNKPPRRGHRPAVDEETQFMEPPSGFVQQVTPNPAEAEEEITSFRVPPRRQVAHEEDEEENPYAAPEANLEQGRPHGRMTGPVTVGVGRGWSWIKDGYGYFRDSPLSWLGAFVVWVLIGIAIQLVPVVGALVFNLVSGFFIAGFMLGAKDQDEGEGFAVKHLFAGFSSNPVQLLLVGVIYLVGFLVIGIGAFLVAGGGAFIPMLFGQELDPAALQEGMGRLWIAILIALGLALPLVMAYWFAPALVAIEGMSALAAMRASLIGCAKNMLPFLLYGLVAMLLMFAAMIPFGLGLLVLVPTLLASTYVAFRDIYYPEAGQ